MTMKRSGTQREEIEVALFCECSVQYSCVEVSTESVDTGTFSSRHPLRQLFPEKTICSVCVKVRSGTRPGEPAASDFCTGRTRLNFNGSKQPGFKWSDNGESATSNSCQSSFTIQAQIFLSGCILNTNFSTSFKSKSKPFEGDRRSTGAYLFPSSPSFSINIGSDDFRS